ncbi:MAG: putative membrane protein [Cenarchaeum symbiont of Oopsacas minuta]|nr:putative membrane protein [Cenarchaeum symbiont of Oopsacas minuta]
MFRRQVIYELNFPTFKINRVWIFGMNGRILIGIAVVGFAIIIGIIGLSGQINLNDISKGSIIQVSKDPVNVKPLEINLEELEVSYIDKKSATMNIHFSVYNPNYKSIILQFIKYEIKESDSSIYAGQIGERPEGFITSSNYFTVLGNGTVALSDIIVLKNTGNMPELWRSLTDGNLNWQVNGQAYYSLSSMTTGGENIVDFILTP